MVDLKRLETFVWVATLGSFRGAAQQLHTTQPAVSHRIAELEEHLGFRLLHRENRTITPTPRGRTLLAYAEKLLGLHAEMLSVVGDASTVRGVLRLGVAETIVHTWLTQFIKKLNVAYPNLALEIEVDVSRNLHDRLLDQEIDIAFLLRPPAAPLVQSRPLCSYPMAFAASPSIAWSQREVPLREIAAHPIVTFARNTVHYAAVRALFNHPDLPPVQMHASTSLATVVRMAVEGLGIAVIPPVIVRTELAEGTLRLVRTRARVPELSFSVSWHATPDTRTVERVAQIAIETAAAHRGGNRKR